MTKSKPTSNGLFDLLRVSAWSHELQAEQLQRVSAQLVVREVLEGGFVCRKGEAPDHWIGVISGLLKLCNESPTGRSVTFTSVPAGGWFGEGSILKNERRKFDAVALRDSSVALMPRSTFDWLFETSLPFNRFLVHQLNARCGQFISMLEIERLQDRDSRVAHCLAILFNEFLYPGVEQHITITQEEIGHLSGLSRQHVNKALHVLERRGLLDIEHRGVTVRDLNGLRTFGQ